MRGGFVNALLGGVSRRAPAETREKAHDRVGKIAKCRLLPLFFYVAHADEARKVARIYMRVTGKSRRSSCGRISADPSQLHSVTSVVARVPVDQLGELVAAPERGAVIKASACALLARRHSRPRQRRAG
jgi:hypothetical protein